MNAKVLLIVSFLIGTFFISCSDDINFENQGKMSNIGSTLLTDTVESETMDNHEMLIEFSKALACSMHSNVELRSVIKSEALKKFNFDYDVLYSFINSHKLSSGITVDELMGSYMDVSILSRIKTIFPTLTIFVPKLPEDSFSAELWKVENDIPEVALRVKGSNDIMAYGVNNEYLIPSNIIPKYPIVVVKLNERVIAVKDMQRTSFSMANSVNKDVVFISDVFNNMNGKSLSSSVKNTLLSDARGRLPEIPANMKKVYEAFDVFSSTDGWQRDYIYYGLTPQKTKGAFNLDMKESVAHFRLLGDPRQVMNKICDQSSDPRIDGNTHEIPTGRPGVILTPWTDGQLEFTVKVYAGSQTLPNGVFTSNFLIEPSYLFKTTNKSSDSHKYEVGSISLTNGISPNTPLFEWDIEKYSSVIKIAISEMDPSETIQTSESTTVSFATNFGYDASFGQTVKHGLKFGANASTSKTVSYTITRNLGDDELGEVLVNFGDKIIKSKNNLSTTRQWIPDYTDKHRTGYYELAISPLEYNRF